jgi:hypothetical protein
MRLPLSRVCGRTCGVCCAVLGKWTVRDGVEYQVRKTGWNGFVRVGAEDLPDVVVSAYEMSRGERAGTEVGMLHRGI